MLEQKVYDKLKELCDKCHAAKEELDAFINNSGSFSDTQLRKKQTEDLAKANEKVKKASDEFFKELNNAIDEICKDIDNPVAESMKQDVLDDNHNSPDNSDYNRINRLRDLDEYVDTIKN